MRTPFGVYTFTAEVQDRIPRPIDWSALQTALHFGSSREFICNHPYVHCFRLKEWHLENKKTSLSSLKSLQYVEEHNRIIAILMDKIQHCFIVIVPLYVSL